MPAWLFLSIAGAAIVVFVGLDMRASAFRAALSTNKQLLARNLGYACGNVLSMSTLAWINSHIVATFADSPQAAFWTTKPVVVEVALAFLLAELINWLSHWIKHVRPWLWMFHVQHHVGRHYDTTLTLHTHGVDVVVSGAVMSLALFCLGFSKLAADVFVLSYFVANLYKHCHARLSLGPLDWVIVGPAFHRVHHTLDLRGNYGSVLTVFDVVFGTAVWPQQLGPAGEIYGRAVGVTATVERGFIDEILLPLRRQTDRAIESACADT